MKKLSIILDCDEVLMECIQPACEIISKRHGISLNKKDIKSWNMMELDEPIRDEMLQLIRSRAFVATQEPSPGAVDFVRALTDRGHKVMVFSAVPPFAMGVRARQILEYFPIAPDNITLGGNKKYMYGDILLDDSLGNIDGSKCRYPVLFRQPWNENDHRFLSVSNYEEMLQLVDKISVAPEPKEHKVTKYGNPGFLALVGPSASGKTSIIQELLKDPRFCLVKAITTRAPRSNDIPGEYRFVTMDEFNKLLAEGSMIEHTEYAGNCYGLDVKDVQEVWDSGRIPVKAMDIVGARAVKEKLGSRAVTVFVRRDREAILESLLNRDSDKKDIVRRIMALDTEYLNEFQCDWTVSNNGSLSDAVSQILRVI